MKNLSKILLLLLSVSLLACSTDDTTTEEEDTPDDNTGTTTEEEFSVGVLVDSEVEGVAYEVLDSEGEKVKDSVTNDKGEFKYKKGHKIRFLLGAILLKELSEGKDQVTPIDLASEDGADENTDEVRNIAAFLQTFDEDGDPSNGIQIKKETREQFKKALDFKTKDFANELENLADSMEIRRSDKKRFKPKTAEEAAEHFVKTTLKKPYVVKNKVEAHFLKIFERLEGGKSQWVHKKNGQGIIAYSLLRLSREKAVNYYKHNFDSNKGLIVESERLIAKVDGLNEGAEDTKAAIDYVSYKWTYDADGKLTGWVKTDGDGNEEEVSNIEIDEKEKTVTKADVKKFGEETKVEFMYKDGLLEKLEVKDKDGNVKESVEISYDANNRPNKRVTKDTDGKVKSSEEIEYDADGKPKKKVRKERDASGVLVEKDSQDKSEEAKQNKITDDQAKKLLGKWVMIESGKPTRKIMELFGSGDYFTNFSSGNDKFVKGTFILDVATKKLTLQLAGKSDDVFTFVLGDDGSLKLTLGGNELVFQRPPKKLGGN